MIEVERLRRVMAAALERVQVGDCEEAEAILGAVVALDGSPVGEDAYTDELDALREAIVLHRQRWTGAVIHWRSNRELWAAAGLEPPEPDSLGAQP